MHRFPTPTSYTLSDAFRPCLSRRHCYLWDGRNQDETRSISDEDIVFDSPVVGDIHGGALIEDDIAPPPSPLADGEDIDDEEIDDNVSSFPEAQLPVTSLFPVRMPSMSKETRARRLVARLRQPFGALLVTLASTGRRTMDYRQVAADNLITVQFQEGIPLADILDNVHVLDVL
ncbi:hypothetical protein EV363DRAFT_1172885 [Boletus edulis]|nr:hypothetical protein EV363DRAFT_1172885 [Boletus edulis]